MKRFLLILVGVLWGATSCGGKQDALILLEELPTVGTIEIRGNEALTDKEIKSVMVLKESSWKFWSKSKLSRFQFDQDQRAILTLYLRRGFPRARIKSTQETANKSKRDIILTISEGDQIQIAGIGVDLTSVVDAELPLSKKDLRGSLNPGDPFDPIQVGAEERLLRRKLAENGYLTAKVKSNVQFQGNLAFLHHRLTPGNQFTVDSVSIKGLRKIKEKSLEGFLTVKPGDRFDIGDVNDSQRNLMRGGYFLSVRSDTTDVNQENKTVGVEFRIKERKLRWVEGGIGFNSEQQVVVNAAWGDRSFARSGLRTVFRDRLEVDLTRSDPISRNLIESIFNKQAFLNTRWAFQPNGFWEHIDDQVKVVQTGGSGGQDTGNYAQNIFGAAAAFRRQIGSDYNQVVISLENRWVYNDADSVARSSDSLLARNFYQTRLIRTSLDFDSRNSFFNPTRGGYMRFVGEFAGGGLGGATSFNKFTVGATRFWPLGKTGALGARLELGMALPKGGHDTRILDAERVPREDRYALGGAYSVRGFDERELDGRGQNPGGLSGGILESLFNVEARWVLVEPVAGVLFLDSGNVWQDRKDFALDRFVPHSDRNNVSAKDVRYSYGLGLRVNTPVGPVRLDYARKWNVPGILTEPRDRWHFALGHAF